MRNIKVYKAVIAEAVAKGQISPERAKMETGYLESKANCCSAFIDLLVAVKTEWKHLDKYFSDYPSMC